MRKLLLALCLFSVVQGHSQTISPSNHTTASTTSLSGSFYVKETLGSVDHTYNVTYYMSPTSVSNNVLVDLYSTFPNAKIMLLKGKLVNASGTVLATWSPSKMDYKTQASFNVSTYSAGSYEVQLFDNDGNKVCTLPFTKI